MGEKIEKSFAPDGVTLGGYIFYCPGCECNHLIWDKSGQLNRPFAWEFNGDFEKPTFTPSLLVNKGKELPNIPVCHLNITNGFIFYHPDVTDHKFKGQNIEMEDVNQKS